MGAIDKFMRSRGYVKLDQYGLVLTPDDRVLSTRPAVLDDGVGNKIVGWVDGDLAAMELDRWGPSAKPAVAKPVVATPMVQPRPPATARPLPGVAPMAMSAAPAPARPAPIAAAPIAAAPAAAPTPMAMAAPAPAPRVMAIAAPAPVMAPVVAAEPVVEEDEWEWEIVMARARAVAEEVEVAATSMAFTKPKAKAPPGPRWSEPANAGERGPKTMPMAVVSSPEKAQPQPMFTITRPESWGDITEMSASAPTTEHQRPTARPTAIPVPAMATAKRSTVIPVPQLPVAANPSDVRPAPHPTRTVSPRTRIARGTGRETVQTQQMPSMMANNDETSPYITLPPEVKAPAGYAHAKLVAAKQR